MHRVRQDELPFVGSSHQFVGAEHGDVNVSMQVDVHLSPRFIQENLAAE